MRVNKWKKSGIDIVSLYGTLQYTTQHHHQRHHHYTTQHHTSIPPPSPSNSQQQTSHRYSCHRLIQNFIKEYHLSPTPDLDSLITNNKNRASASYTQQHQSLRRSLWIQRRYFVEFHNPPPHTSLSTSNPNPTQSLMRSYQTPKRYTSLTA